MVHRRITLMCLCVERSDVAISGRRLRFRRNSPVIRHCTARLPRRPLASSQCQTIGFHLFNDSLFISQVQCRARLSAPRRKARCCT